MSLRVQPATVVQDRPDGLLELSATTGFTGREWWGGLFLLGFIVWWCVTLGPLLGMAANATGAALIFLLAFAGLWLPLGPLLVVILVWGTLGGRETVLVDDSRVVLRQGLGRLVLTRVRSTADVSDARVLAGETVFRSGHAVAFAARGRTLRFGNWTDRAEAARVARALSDRLATVAQQRRPTRGEIEFLPRPEWTRDIFLLFWLVAWVAGGSALLGQVGDGDWQLVAVTAAWLLGAALVAAVLLRDVARRQRVVARPAGLELRTSLGPLRRTRRYGRPAIHGLTAEPVLTEDGPDEDRFELVLDVGARSVRFGIGLTKAKAEAAAVDLNRRLLG